MNNTAKNRSADTGAIVWNRKKVWGSVGMTYFTEVAVGGDTYRFTIDQARKGEWVTRGWVNGSFTMRRDSNYARTLVCMKAVVAAYVTELRDKAKGGSR